ncbi:hypothetical protein V1264_024806 [Littorina saxatilis]|uniref:Uncharacterized protein n=1 Tax=Littorina saxatilis TaxID=31220 RepID=A0AAN9FYP8_9CAEN
MTTVPLFLGSMCTSERTAPVVRGKLLRKMVGDNEKLTSKCKVDLARMPPCQSALMPHIQRVNHRVALYKRAHEGILERPKPYDQGQGWTKNADGVLEPVWCLKPILPVSLIDLLADGGCEEEDDEEDEEEDEEVDFDAFAESDDEF